MILFGSSVFAIGLCVTPYGVYGVIPCDTACIGSSMISGAANQASALAKDVSTYTQTTADVATCAANITASSTQFQLKVSTIQAKLTAELGIQSLAELGAADGLTLAMSSAMDLYTKWMESRALDAVNFITVMKNTLLKIHGQRLERNELPNTEIATSLSETYYTAINNTKERIGTLAENTLTTQLTIQQYEDLLENPLGKSELVNSEYASYKEEALDVIYDIEAETFSPPLFNPVGLPIYSEADLLMSALLLRNTLSCFTQQGSTPYGNYSCSIISGKIDVDAVSETTNGKATVAKDSVNSAFTEAIDKTSEPKEELASSSCLDGMMGLGIEASVIDISSLNKNILMTNLRDYIIGMACSYVVDQMNEQVSVLNDALNAQAGVINAISGGMISIESSTNTTGIFGASTEIQDIRGTELGAEISQEFNEEINNAIFGDSNIFGGAGDIDFLNAEYSSTTSENTLNIDAKEALDSAQCWLLGESC